MRRIIYLALTLLAGNASAATVFKCVDAAGKVTFTQQSCPTASAFTDVVSAANAAPSGSSAASRMNHDDPAQGLGGINVSGTGPVTGSAPVAPVAPRQENTPMRKAVNYQRFPTNCVRWVDKIVRTKSGSSQYVKVAAPCG